MGATVGPDGLEGGCGGLFLTGARQLLAALVMRQQRDLGEPTERVKMASSLIRQLLPALFWHLLILPPVVITKSVA